MGMAAGNSGDEPSGEINVTPLVDVCLVLLIIFMVMVPKTIPEISVRIPPESKRPNTFLARGVWRFCPSALWARVSRLNCPVT